MMYEGFAFSEYMDDFYQEVGMMIIQEELEEERCYSMQKEMGKGGLELAPNDGQFFDSHHTATIPLRTCFFFLLRFFSPSLNQSIRFGESKQKNQ